MRVIVFSIYIIFMLIISIPIIILDKLNLSKKDLIGIFLKFGFKYLLKVLNCEVNINKNLDDIKSTLIVSNHLSIMDAVVAYYLFSKNTIFISKKENGKIPILKTWLKSQNTLFLDRKNVREGVKIIIDAKKHIENENNVYIFPQGTRNPNTEDFKAGSLQIAKKSKCDILPIFLTNTDKILKFNLSYKKIKIKVDVKQTIKNSEYQDMNSTELQKYVQNKVYIVE